LGQRQHLAGLEGDVPAPVSDPFGGHDLRALLRGGASDAEIAAAIGLILTWGV